MTDFQLSTPVAFIIFNRPDTTTRVFEVIRQAKPPQLLVIADGPRPNHPEDVEKCAAARAIIEQVDWDCEVLRDFAESNMGCKQRVSSGLDWVFGTVQEAIILEDDCLPHPTFFQFCEELLKHYRDDTRVMAINGTNVLGKWKADIQDYHFSYHGGIWGWASWRRAWEYYDVSMNMWNDAEARQRIRDVVADEEQYMLRERVFNEVYYGKIDTWDYQWLFARLIQSGLSITPSVNLISNIGFREDATHTKSKNALAELDVSAMQFPLRFHRFVAVDRDYDRRWVQVTGNRRSVVDRLKSRFSTKWYVRLVSSRSRYKSHCLQSTKKGE
jgi:hypothetical protein